MDLHVDLGAVERVEGIRAWVAYLIGAVVGTLVALPIIQALFGVQVPLI
jgi:hypothetical protein